MKLAIPLDICASIMHARSSGSSSEAVTHVAFDSRKIHTGTGGLFFALNGLNRDGAQFIRDAWEKGIRWFVVNENAVIPDLSNAVFLQVADPLKALQQLAAHHRNQFSYPVIGITGSLGKTTFKEWAYQLLSPEMRVIRSPKSYNSQIGVALSLLELHADADIALIEAGISEPGEMEILEQMIQPTIGVFTTFGTAHRHHFESAEQHLTEKLRLFKNCDHTFIAASIAVSPEQLSSVHGEKTGKRSIDQPWFTPGYEPILGLLEAVGKQSGLSETVISKRLERLPQLALRMETFEGINGNTIVNDTYNLDTDALVEALQYQQRLAKDQPRIVVIGLTQETASQQERLRKLIEEFQPKAICFITEGASIPWTDFQDSVVLVKGSRDLHFEQEVSKGKLLKHLTHVEVSLSAIRHNLQYFRKRLQPGTTILCMMKAASYGAGADRTATFLQQEGVNYFGVAFADEGIALREAGITVPIMVMNPDPENAGLFIEHQLEPAIYSFQQLDSFITELIHRGITHYPVHLKFDTGMHRLGFAPEEKERVLSAVLAQPEIRIRGIYSHLADADNTQNPEFTHRQITAFEEIRSWFERAIGPTFIAHLLNSEGALHFSEAQYDMIRLGIGLYGYPDNPGLQSELHPAIQWKSVVSQVRVIPAGDFVGYGCSFQAQSDMSIAVIPVGYADGFRRSLSNGKGVVYIKGKRCQVVGKVCMDMIIVDVTGHGISEQDEVEIIGLNQSMAAFAEAMDTIPYEVMTGLSLRMHRVYVED